jgi:hypothetical protein
MRSNRTAKTFKFPGRCSHGAVRRPRCRAAAIQTLKIILLFALFPSATRLNQWNRGSSESSYKDIPSRCNDTLVVLREPLYPFTRWMRRTLLRRHEPHARGALQYLLRTRLLPLLSVLQLLRRSLLLRRLKPPIVSQFITSRFRSLDARHLRVGVYFLRGSSHGVDSCNCLGRASCRSLRRHRSGLALIRRLLTQRHAIVTCRPRK